MRLGLAEVRAYQVHLVSAGVSWGAFNHVISGFNLPRSQRRRKIGRGE